MIDFAQAMLGPNNLSQLNLTNNPLNIKAVQSLTIALKESKLQRLSMSFGDSDLESQLEDALVDLICESISSNCTVSLGSIGYSIQSKAKLRYII